MSFSVPSSAPVLLHRRRPHPVPESIAYLYDFTNVTSLGSRDSTLMPGEEIFVPYTHGSSYILTADDIDDRREHWYYVAKGRKITIGVPTPRISSTPAPPRGGEGGNHHAGARVFQHVAGVSAPT
mgnify:CR=1 FL=1